jgi:hypothetical protein
VTDPLQGLPSGARAGFAAREPGIAASTSTRTAWWSCAAIFVVCLAVGLPTVRSDNYFLGDDFGLVQHLHDVPVERLVSYFVSDWTQSIYGVVLDELRPLLAFTYWLDAHLYGPLNVSGYHATNVVLHLLNALLVLAIARSVIPREPRVALLAATLFALMPSHAEPIAWISGRVDSLASLFYLGAFLCFVRFRLGNRRAWLAGALLTFACGLFVKQSLVTFPVLILAFDLIGPRFAASSGGRWQSRLSAHVPFFLLAGAYLALRHALFGNAVREDLLTVAAIEEFIYRQNRYVRELLPAPNNAPRAIRLLGEVVTVAVLALCARWLFVRRRACAHAVARLHFFGAAWYCITIAPMVVTYLSARHLYITTAGLSIALASLLLPGDAGDERGRTRMRMAMAGTLVALFAVAAIWNVSTWVTSGVESQRFASALPRLLQSAPRGSIVLLSVPEWNRDGWFWAWATPFALQPPFTSDDLYQSFRIVERPPVYCCPPDQWWAAKKPAVMALLDSPGLQQVTEIAFAPDNPGAATLTTRTIDGPALKQRLESALGRPVESFTGTAAETQELGRMLFD